jgi:hypothetical protein
MPRANSGEQWLPLSDVLDEKGGGGNGYLISLVMTGMQNHQR